MNPAYTAESARVTAAEILVTRAGDTPEVAAQRTGANLDTLRNRLARQWRKGKLPPGVYDAEMGVE